MKKGSCTQSVCRVPHQYKRSGRRRMLCRTALLVLLGLILCLSSCKENTPSSIEILENTTPPAEGTPGDWVVNLSSQTIHTDPACPHAARISDANRRFISQKEEEINTLIAMGYRFCKSCEEGNPDKDVDRTEIS